MVPSPFALSFMLISFLLPSVAAASGATCGAGSSRAAPRPPRASARPTGISFDGQTIVGTGINPNGQTEAWFAVIPEPGTGLLVMTGLLGLAARRQRRA
jgi:hypothetical protein